MSPEVHSNPQAIERRGSPLRLGGDSCPVRGRTDSHILPSSHPVILHPSGSQDHVLWADWRCRLEKALARRRESVSVLVSVTGRKREGDDLGKFRGFGHEEGNEAAEYVSKCLREEPYPHKGPHELLWPQPVARQGTLEISEQPFCDENSSRVEES